MKENRLSKFLDGLDRTEQNKILNDTSLEGWRKNFIIRFYEQLANKNLLKKDITKNVNKETDKYKLLPNGYKLPTSSLTEYTNIDSSKSLRKPSIDVLIAISNSLNVSIDYLLGIEECENHENTDIHKVIGLDDNAINVLKNNKALQKQANVFLINPQLIKLVQSIEHQKHIHLVYYGVSKEFSNSLYYKIEIAYNKFNRDTFPLDRSISKYKDYLLKEINFKEISGYSTVNNYINQNISKDLLDQFKHLKNKECICDKDIYISFITFIADFTFEIFENYHNKEQELLKISQSFTNIIQKYIKEL